MTDRNVSPAADAFDFTAPAELYIGRGAPRRHGLRFRQFDTAAEALQFAMERPRPVDEVALMECDDRRYSSAEMAALYHHAAYPLEREPGTVPPVRAAISVPVAGSRKEAAQRAPAAQPVPGPPASPLAAVHPRHKYALGDRLKIQGGGNTLSRLASYCRVTFVLPYEGRQLLYRVKSEMEAFERVVAEADLSPEA